jgi:hypothetical protein
MARYKVVAHETNGGESVVNLEIVSGADGGPETTSLGAYDDGWSLFEEMPIGQEIDINWQAIAARSGLVTWGESDGGK